MNYEANHGHLGYRFRLLPMKLVDYSCNLYSSMLSDHKALIKKYGSIIKTSEEKCMLLREVWAKCMTQNSLNLFGGLIVMCIDYVSIDLECLS